MSIFSKIFDKIFDRSGNAAPQGAGTAGQPGGSVAQAAPAPPAATQGAAPGAAPVSPQAAPPVVVDVEAVLVDMAANNPQKLNWRTSIVDLMKLVGMESSLSERQELARELGYTGSLTDTATMNVWLHKQVMRKMAENGGQVPSSLLD